MPGVSFDRYTRAMASTGRERCSMCGWVKPVDEFRTQFPSRSVVLSVCRSCVGYGRPQPQPAQPVPRKLPRTKHLPCRLAGERCSEYCSGVPGMPMWQPE